MFSPVKFCGKELGAAKKGDIIKRFENITLFLVAIVFIGNRMVLSAIRDLSSTRKYFKGYDYLLII